MMLSYMPDRIWPQPRPGGIPTHELRDGLGRNLTRAYARASKVMRDGIDLYVVLYCIRGACGLPAMLLVLDAMRKSRRERAAVLRDARRHPYWALLRRMGRGR